MFSNMILPKGLICEQVVSSKVYKSSEKKILRYLEGKYWSTSTRQNFFHTIHENDKFFCKVFERFDINRSPKPFLVKTWTLPQEMYSYLRTNRFLEEREEWTEEKVKKALNRIRNGNICSSRPDIQENMLEIIHLFYSFMSSKKPIRQIFSQEHHYSKDLQDFFVFYENGALHCMLPWRDGWYISSTDQYRKTKQDIKGSAKSIFEHIQKLNTKGLCCSEEAWEGCSVLFPASSEGKFQCSFPVYEIYKCSDSMRSLLNRPKKGGHYDYRDVFQVADSISPTNRSLLCLLFIFSEYYTHDFIFSKSKSLAIAQKIKESSTEEAIAIVEMHFKELPALAKDKIDQSRQNASDAMHSIKERLAPIALFFQKYALRVVFGVLLLGVVSGLSYYAYEKTRDLSSNPVLGDDPFHQIMDEIHSGEGTPEEEKAEAQLKEYFSETAKVNTNIQQAKRHFRYGKTKEGVTVLITNKKNKKKIKKKTKKKMAKSNYEKSNQIKSKSETISYENSIDYLNRGMWSMLYCLSHEDEKVCTESSVINTSLLQNTSLPTWLRVEAGMNLIYTQDKRKEKFNVDEVHSSCSLFVDHLKTALKYENLNFPIRICMKNSDSQEEMLKWAVLYRKSRKGIYQDQLYPYLPHPSCAGKKSVPAEKRTVKDPSSYCSWLFDSLKNESVAPLPDDLDQGFFANTENDTLGWNKSKEILEDYF